PPATTHLHTLSLHDALPIYPLEKGVKMGPLVTAAHRDRVMAYVEDGKRSGARIVLGGKTPGGSLARGAYVEPTIFDAVDPSAKIDRKSTRLNSSHRTISYAV